MSNSPGLTPFGTSICSTKMRVMSLGPPTEITLPLSSAMVLIAGFASSEYGGAWTSRRMSASGAPFSMARIGSTRPELVETWAEPRHLLDHVGIGLGERDVGVDAGGGEKPFFDRHQLGQKFADDEPTEMNVTVSAAGAGVASTVSATMAAACRRPATPRNNVIAGLPPPASELSYPRHPPSARGSAAQFPRR